MKIVDNSPLNVSSIGSLIEESCAIGCFYDCRIYILSSVAEESLIESAKNVMSEFNKNVYEDDFFNQYDLETISLPDMSNHPNLEKVIAETSSNVLMQLNTPGAINKYFIIAKVSLIDLHKDLALMIYESERLSKAYFSLLIRRCAMDAPKTYEEVAKKAISRKDFFANYVGNLVGSIVNPSFGMTTIINTPINLPELDKVVSFKKKIDIANHLQEKLEAYRKTNDPIIGAELDMFFSSINHRTWQNLIAKQSPKAQTKLLNLINPVKQAESSIMDLEVSYIGKIDKPQTTNGKYRLFMKKGYDTLLVHFQRRNSFIIYLIYLLDRKKKGNDVDTLNLNEYKEVFTNLYTMVYGAGGSEEFDTMMKHFNEKNEVKQKGVNSIFYFLKTDVGNTCERMHEPPEPFIVNDRNSHLTVLPKHIILPNEIISLI